MIWIHFHKSGHIIIVINNYAAYIATHELHTLIEQSEIKQYVALIEYSHKYQIYWIIPAIAFSVKNT